MVPGINIPIIRCFPVKVFFILMCVIALMVPVSADHFLQIPPRIGSPSLFQIIPLLLFRTLRLIQESRYRVARMPVTK